MIKKRKVGFFAAGAFDEMPLEKACDILKAIGYDGIELPKSRIDACKTAAELEKLTATVKEKGLELSELVAQQDYVQLDEGARQTAVAATEEAIRRCGDAGIPVINLFTGPRPWIPNRVVVGQQLTVGRAWDMIFAAFDRLVPLAEQKGVALAVENVWGMVCGDFYTTQYLINHYNSPNLGVNFDPSHDQLFGNWDMEFLLKGWGAQRIKHIHMKDAAGTQVRGNVLFPPLGEGLVDWAGFVKGLDAIGYKGMLSVEYEADQHLTRTLKGDWVAAAEESYRALETIL